MPDVKRINEIAALRNFFGVREGQSLQQFAAEVRELSPAEKTELARLAAAELGCELETAKQ